MIEYTVREYDKQDYEIQEQEINEMSKDELSREIIDIARGWLPDYNYTGEENDFENHRRQMIVDRVAKILKEI